MRLPPQVPSSVYLLLPKQSRGAGAGKAQVGQAMCASPVWALLLAAASADSPEPPGASPHQGPGCPIPVSLGTSLKIEAATQWAYPRLKGKVCEAP